MPCRLPHPRTLPSRKTVPWRPAGSGPADCCTAARQLTRTDIVEGLPDVRGGTVVVLGVRGGTAVPGVRGTVSTRARTGAEVHRRWMACDSSCCVRT